MNLHPVATAPGSVFVWSSAQSLGATGIGDQYQVSTDKRSGITNDPTRADDPQYLVPLIGEVITVTMKTVKFMMS